MFSKLSFFVFLAPLVSALTLQAPTNPSSGGSVTINWTTTAGDPSTFSLELTNPSFNNAIAIANNVDATLNTITLTLPIVAAGGSYTIQAVNIGNINQVFAETAIFSVAPTVSSSVSATTATLSSGTGTATANSLPVASSTGGASTIGAPSTVTGLTSVTGTSTGTTTAAATTTSTAAAVSSRFALTNAGGYAVLMLAAVAGAAAVAF